MIDAKKAFMRRVEQRMADKLTVSAMTELMTVLADVLQGFSMTENPSEGVQTDDLLQCYLDALKVEGRSEKTIWNYECVIRRMMEAVRTPTRQITVYHLRSWIAGMKEHGLQDTTMEGYRQVICAYFNWLQRESLISGNPTANLGAIKCAKKTKSTLDSAEMERLYRNCKTVRDKAIIHFLSSTGCRISEMTQLNRDGIDFQTRTCIVRGKGDKERTVFFDKVTAMILKEYLMSRGDEEPALFIGQRKERITPNGIRAMLHGIEKRAGIQQRVHPHKFRRTLATNMNRRGMEIQMISKLLGHEKLDTTMKYVMISNEETKNAYQKYA